VTTIAGMPRSLSMPWQVQTLRISALAKPEARSITLIRSASLFQKLRSNPEARVLEAPEKQNYTSKTMRSSRF
jgi:hypothetical protein